MSKLIHFPVNRPPVDDHAFRVLDRMDDQIESRVAIRTKIAKAILDELASGKCYAGARRKLVKTPEGATEEHLIIDYKVRYQRSLNEGPAVPLVDPKA